MLKFIRFWSNLRNLISKTNKFFLLMVLSSSLVVTFALAPSTAQVSKQLQSPTQQSNETQSKLEVGWEFPGSRELNESSITEVEYEGECVGKESGSTKAWFTSSRTSPAPKRRVVIRNVTRGVASDPYPYTDREYEQGRASEATRMTFGTSHSKRHLNVLEGENEFEYEIKEKRNVIDSGSFTAVIEKITDVRRRDAVASKDSVCVNTDVPLNVCADIRTQTKYTCPGGRILRSLFEPNNSEISTLISNQTFTDVRYILNGEIQKLSSGDSRTYTGNSLSIGFNPSCTTCNPTTTLGLQPGRRYRFSSSQLNSGNIQLVDFQR